jgi:hypothetical protein
MIFQVQLGQEIFKFSRTSVDVADGDEPAFHASGGLAAWRDRGEDAFIAVGGERRLSEPGEERDPFGSRGTFFVDRVIRGVAEF